MKTYYGRVVQHKHRKFCFVLDRDKPQGFFSGLDWYGEVRASSLKIAVSKLVELYLKDRALTDDGASSVERGLATGVLPIETIQASRCGKTTTDLRAAIQRLGDPAYTPPTPVVKKKPGDTPVRRPGRPFGYRKCVKCGRIHIPGGC